jgi:uncharacterized protein YeaO (DUF488 family)
MIFTSYFANVKKLPSNVIPIAICINPPRGYRGLWYPKLAPDYDILKRYRRDRDEADYRKLFTRRVLDNLSIDTVLRDISEMALPNVHVALICYEKSEDFCHRQLVAEWFRSNGIECREWGGV